MTGQYKHYVKELLNIAFPIILGNLGFILIGVGDVLIAGQHSTDTLAAISIATAIINCIQIFGVGIIGGVSPLLSNYRGSKKQTKKYLFPTIRFSMFLAFIIMLVTLAFIPLIDKFDYGSLTPMIKEYMLISALATFGGYLHAAVKEYLQAYEIVLFPNLLTAFAVILNIVLNIILVFGYGPIPSLGVLGLALASFIVRYFMGFVLLIYCLSIMKFKDCKDWNFYNELLKIGIPISCAIMVEFVAFNSIAIVMGKVSGIYAAAQNMICTMTTVSFMVPLAISNAIGVKVGYANGEGNTHELKKYAFIGTIMSVGFMLCSAAIFANFPEFLVKLFTSDVILIKIAVPIVYILSIFQIFDGLQIALSGIFKGLKKTNVILFSNFTAYWIISMPLGYFLAFKCNLYLKGFWIGLVSAAIVLCCIMGIILLQNLRKLEHKN